MYVTVPAPWHLTDVDPRSNARPVTTGVIVTVCDDVVGPLHPVAVAVITDVPDQPATYVTAPVDELIELPADVLVASRAYVIPVLVVAVAVCFS